MPVRSRHAEAAAEADPAELLLVGPGAGGGTVRIGDTVRREPGRASDAMLSVLRHLESVGFAGAPRVLGQDDRGRRVLSYVHGDVALPPYQPWAADDSLLTSVATLLRDYHRAVADYRPPPGIRWPTRAPADQRGALVGHLDVSMANVVCRGGRAVALIDFEEVGLVTALWDVVRTVRHWVPLLAPEDIPDGLAGLRGRQGERLRLFADTYGLTAAERAALVETVLLNADDSYERMRLGAADGHPGYSAEWTGQAARRNRRARDWVQANRGCLEGWLSGRLPGDGVRGEPHD
ncbi:phosphotransferase [Streptomyces sp. CG1]|uniref:phosphotransferase n=1 Tax=Streptomyces sp. CG1 TaxID=1287523 RepID=UPI0034E293E9